LVRGFQGRGGLAARGWQDRPAGTNEENIMAQDEDDPRARYANAEREHAEAKRALARAKLEKARREWEMVHTKTQEYLNRGKRQRDG
jgi:hypothetical protein